MRKKLLLALSVALLLATAAIAVVTLPIFTPSRPVREQVIERELVIGNKVSVSVYRGGRLVQSVEKVGDPWLRNLFVLIADCFLGRYYTNPLEFYDINGAAYKTTEWEQYGISGTPILAVGIGGSDIAVTLYDYDLGLPYARVDVASDNVLTSDNGTMITISVSASWVADSNVTVKEVGLYWKGVAPRGGDTARYVLIARDLLPTPLSVVENDSVIVSYTIYIPYDRAPVLKNLAVLIANYIFGLNEYGKAYNYVTTDGTSTTDMDIGEERGTSPYDIVNEYTYLAAGSGLAIYRPTLNKLYSEVKRSTDPVQIDLSFNSTHAVFSLAAGVVTFTETTTITEVGIVIQSTDIDDGPGYAKKDVLVLYFPLEQSIKVPAGSGIKFTFKLAIRLSP